MPNDLGKILSKYAIVAICLLACQQKHAPIAIDKMKLIMWDMFTADEWYNELQIKDTVALKNKVNIGLYKNVLQKHNVTKEVFFESYNYYLAHPTDMQILIDSVEAYGVRKKQQFQATKK